MTRVTGTAASGVQGIAKAVAVLRAFKSEPSGLSTSEIADLVEMPQSTVRKIVAALRKERLLTKAGVKGRVKLGSALVRLAAGAQIGLETVIHQFAFRLSRLAKETVELSVLEGSKALVVDHIQGAQRLTAVSAVGDRVPLHCTAGGKALLAVLPAQRQKEQLSARLQRFTSATITDGEILEKQLREFQVTQLCYEIEEHNEGICAVATAFRDAIGRHYSLSIPIPASRFHAQQALLARLVIEIKDELLNQLHPNLQASAGWRRGYIEGPIE
jgi:DNA-binding IclR family transcriptional regulator